MGMMSKARLAAKSIDVFDRVSQFYGYESMLLDEGRLREWLDLLDEKIDYLIPVREAAGERGDEILKEAYRVRDDKTFLTLRVDRVETGIAYSEAPASRTVRTVGNLCLLEDAENGVVGTSTTVMVYRHRGVDEVFDLIPIRRYDRLKVSDNDIKILSRVVVTGSTSLATPNLGIFL